jgi:hypothetical protein
MLPLFSFSFLYILPKAYFYTKTGAVEQGQLQVFSKLRNLMAMLMTVGAIVKYP